MKRLFLIFGPPNAGKGTLLKKITDRFSLPIIGCGDICRDEKRKNSELYREATEHMKVTRSTLWPTELLMKAFEPRYFTATEQHMDVGCDGFLRRPDQVPHIIRLASHADQRVVLIDAECSDEECISRAMVRDREDDKDIHCRLEEHHGHSVPARDSLLASAAQFPVERIVYDGERPEGDPYIDEFVTGLGHIYCLEPQRTVFNSTVA